MSATAILAKYRGENPEHCTPHKTGQGYVYITTPSHEHFLNELGNIWYTTVKVDGFDVNVIEREA